MARIVFGLGLILFAAFASFAEAAPLRSASSALWLQEIEQQAIQDGVSPEVVHAALDNFVPNPRVLELDQKQPETTITFEAYRHNAISSARIKKGAELLEQYAKPLEEIGAKTGVPPEIVVALWAMESSFGQNMGEFETINSLATLAYQGRRADFFRSELIAALHILDREKMSADELRGSWAGAMGQCQFMPSTYLKFAVHATGEGKPDIWNDPLDVLSSIANYLAADGWKRGAPWGHEVDSAPSDTNSASYMQPDGEGTAGFVVTDNVRALMRWNHSNYFALSVGLLADKIRENQ